MRGFLGAAGRRRKETLFSFSHGRRWSATGVLARPSADGQSEWNGNRRIHEHRAPWQDLFLLVLLGGCVYRAAASFRQGNYTSK